MENARARRVSIMKKMDFIIWAASSAKLATNASMKQEEPFDKE